MIPSPLLRSLLLGTALSCIPGTGGSAVVDEKAALESALRADVTMLATTIGPRSVFQEDTLERTAGYIASRLEQAGWVVRRQGYVVSGKTCENLEVERRGSEAPNDVVIIGAHYDTVPVSPGADDNGSGVAALLALAEHFAKGNGPLRTLRFVAFVNEEPIYFQTDLMGSRVYARECKARGDHVVAMLSLESMGYYSNEKKSQKYPFPLSLIYPAEGNFLAFVGNRDSAALVKRAYKIFTSTKTLPAEKAALPAKLTGVGWSDHWAFWQEGYPAIMVTDTAIFRNPNYHQRSDTPDTLSYDQLGQAVRGLQAVVADLAGVE